MSGRSPPGVLRSTIRQNAINIARVPLFRVTKKLAAALKLKLRKAAVDQPPEEHEWFADLFYVERKKCVIWVHRMTLLTFVRPAVIAAELREFPSLFRYEFRTALASMALPESLIERCGIYHPETYAPTNDRAIVGSMLDYRKMFELMVECEGGLPRTDVAGLNVQLNQSPMSVLGMESAVRVAGGGTGGARTLH
jgi:hypothetical protein